MTTLARLRFKAILYCVSFLITWMPSTCWSMAHWFSVNNNGNDGANGAVVFVFLIVLPSRPKLQSKMYRTIGSLAGLFLPCRGRIMAMKRTTTTTTTTGSSTNTAITAKVGGHQDHDAENSDNDDNNSEILISYENHHKSNDNNDNNSNSHHNGDHDVDVDVEVEEAGVMATTTSQ